MYRWVAAQGIGDEHVGSKCVNLWRMAERMSPLVPVPAAVALPFSAWPRLLSLPENGTVAGSLNSGTVTGLQAEALVQQVCASALPAISEFYLSETQKIVLNIRKFSICTGTIGVHRSPSRKRWHSAIVRCHHRRTSNHYSSTLN